MPFLGDAKTKRVPLFLLCDYMYMVEFLVAIHGGFALMTKMKGK